MKNDSSNQIDQKLEMIEKKRRLKTKGESTKKKYNNFN